jgi:hypothetical protein
MEGAGAGGFVVRVGGVFVRHVLRSEEVWKYCIVAKGRPQTHQKGQLPSGHGSIPR